MNVQRLIPHEAGKKIFFETENSRKWLVMKKSEDTYVLMSAGEISPERSRWGNKEQIENELRFLAENGHLAPASEQRW